MLEFKERCLFIGSLYRENEIKISNFYQLVGNSEYLKLLNRFFN